MRPQLQTAPAPGEELFSSHEIETGRLHAILSYLVPLFLIVPLRRRENAFAVFHARQALALWLATGAAALVLCIGVIVLVMVLLYVPISVTIGLLLLVLFLGAGYVAVVGARNAITGRSDVLPLVGQYGESHLSLIVKHR